MAEPDSTKPLHAVEYREHLALLLGPAAGTPDDSDAPIVTVVDQIFRLAIARQAEEIGFTVRADDALEIRLRKGGSWTSLPPLAARGSVVSRLFVLGRLKKGEAERSRPQKAHAVIHGTRMVFETQPRGRWKEDLRVRILGGSFVCSGCMSEHSSGAIHVIPWWNSQVQDFVTTYRCDRCRAQALKETRLKTLAPDEDVRRKFCEFLMRQGHTEEAESARRLPLGEAARKIELLLDRIESGELVLGPL